jgi:hypothetical protein
MLKVVIPGLTRNPAQSWIPALRLREDKLRGKDDFDI